MDILGIDVRQESHKNCIKNEKKAGKVLLFSEKCVLLHPLNEVTPLSGKKKKEFFERFT